MKLIIAGSRTFDDFCLLEKTINEITKDEKEDNIIIISGKAQGADTLGERYAKKYCYPVVEMPADWNRYGRLAGPKRNFDMAMIATHCVCFWDGKSRGTKSMISIAKENNLKLKVIVYE